MIAIALFNQAMKTILYIFITSLVFCSAARSQQASLPAVSGNFKDIPVDSFLIQLEQQTNYHFYFDTAQLGALKINVTATNQSLKQVLDAAFANTGIYYAIYNNNVFVTKGLQVQTTLPGGFFSGKQNSTDILAGSMPGTTTDTTKFTSNAENKLIIVGENTDTGANRFTVAGYVKDAKTGEPVIGAAVADQETRAATTTDQYGYFLLTLPKGRHTIALQSIAMRDTKRQILVQGNGNNQY